MFRQYIVQLSDLTIFGLQALFVLFWILALYIIFSHLNARKDYDLFLKWMVMSNEIPPQEERIGRVAGFSRRENSNFWMKEQNFNYYWYRVVSCLTLLLSPGFTVQLFMLHFDVNPLTYILVQAFNVFHCVYVVFHFFHSLYTTQLFCLQIIHFFCLKFKCIVSRLRYLNASGNSKLKNRRLARLIHQYNRVQLELIEANNFFKNFLGVNAVVFFFYALLMMFLVIFIDWTLRLAILSTLLGLSLTTIVVPFAFSNWLLIDVCWFLFSGSKSYQWN